MEVGIEVSEGEEDRREPVHGPAARENSLWLRPVARPLPRILDLPKALEPFRAPSLRSRTPPYGRRNTEDHLGSDRHTCSWLWILVIYICTRLPGRAAPFG